MSNVRDPDVAEIWGQNRDNINLVVGAILGAYLGLSITKEGLNKGTQFDLFMLVTFTAFASSQLMTFGNRWFGGRKYFAIFILSSFLVSAVVSFRAADSLGMDVSVFVTIYIAWTFLIVAQIATYEVSMIAKKKLKNDRI